MPEQSIDPELTALAGALAHMKPRPAALDRDALMFRAGQASAPRGWKWPLATVASMLVAVGLGVALLIRPQPTVVDRPIIVKVVVPAEETPAPKSDPPTEAAALAAYEPEAPPLTDYQRLQDHLLRWGFDGLPPAPHAAPPQETRDRLLKSL